MGGYIGKGNWNEWETARAISLWLTEGKDKTQLIRSVMSGGHVGLRKAAENQVGDLAPNGPIGKEFRKRFGVECKHTADQPEWWHLLTCKKLESWETYKWWIKIQRECEQHRLEPLLIMRRNRCPMVVMMRSALSAMVSPGSRAIKLEPLGATVITFADFTAVTPATWYAAAEVLHR